MKIKEKFGGWRGLVKLEKVNIRTGKRKIINYRNHIMDDALDAIISSLMLYPDPNLTLMHCAIGDDDTAETDSDETLGNEIFRTPVLSRLSTGTGEVESRAIILDREPEDLSGICTIKEIGFFAGTTSANWDSGAGKDTGLLVARLVLASPESKLADEQINITRTDTISRA